MHDALHEHMVYNVRCSARLQVLGRVGQGGDIEFAPFS